MITPILTPTATLNSIGIGRTIGPSFLLKNDNFLLPANMQPEQFKHTHTHAHTHTHIELSILSALLLSHHPRDLQLPITKKLSLSLLPCCRRGDVLIGFLFGQTKNLHPPTPSSFNFLTGGGGMLVWCQKGAVRKRKLWPAFLRKGRFLRSFEFLKRIHFLLDLLLLLLSMYGPDFYIKHFSIPSDFLDYKC